MQHDVSAPSPPPHSHPPQPRCPHSLHPREHTDNKEVGLQVSSRLCTDTLPDKTRCFTHEAHRYKEFLEIHFAMPEVTLIGFGDANAAALMVTAPAS